MWKDIYWETKLDPTSSGGKPFACSQCGKSFAQKYSLIRHLLIHSGEKPYACNQCKKTFTKSGNLTQHMKTHLAKTRLARKSLPCSRCCRIFEDSRGLADHISVPGEKRYACCLCGMKFAQRSNLTQHFCTSSMQQWIIWPRMLLDTTEQSVVKLYLLASVAFLKCPTMLLTAFLKFYWVKLVCEAPKLQ